MCRGRTSAQPHPVATYTPYISVCCTTEVMSTPMRTCRAWSRTHRRRPMRRAVVSTSSAMYMRWSGPPMGIGSEVREKKRFTSSC